MPTYEYECEKCGTVFERYQKMTDTPVKRCPECKGKVKRLISGGAGILFKGSGFYQTDHRSPEYKKAAKSEKDSSTPSKSSETKENSGEKEKPSSSVDT
jgi:putative FmdB family regulatory protein